MDADEGRMNIELFKMKFLILNFIKLYYYYIYKFITQHIKTNPGFVFNSSMEIITQYYY